MTTRPEHWAELFVSTNRVSEYRCRDCDWTTRAATWASAKKAVIKHWRETHEESEPDPGPYRAEPCGCGHSACKSWHVWPVAAIVGVCFTREQAEAVTELLNKACLSG